MSIKEKEFKWWETTEGDIGPGSNGIFWLDYEDKVGNSILDLGFVPDLPIPVRIFNIADCTVPGVETVRHIREHRLTRKQIRDISVDKTVSLNSTERVLDSVGCMAGRKIRFRMSESVIRWGTFI